MFALYALFSVAEAGDRLFLPIAGQQPLTQSGETVYVPVNQAWAETPQLVPAGAIPQGYYVDVLPQEERSVPMSWAVAGAVLLGVGAYYAGRVATLGAGGSVRSSVRTARSPTLRLRLVFSNTGEIPGVPQKTQLISKATVSCIGQWSSRCSLER